MYEKQRGFTLLEVMVVLVIAGLTSTLLYQMSGFFLNVHSRVLQHVDRQTEELLSREWLAQTVAHLSPDYDQPFGGVKGNRDSLSFLSLSSLEDQPGAPVRIHWRIQRSKDGSNLIYQSGESAWLVKTIIGAQLEFQYRNSMGIWSGEWPPDGMRKSDLPAMILLTTLEGNNNDIYLPVLGDWTPPPVFQVVGE